MQGLAIVRTPPINASRYSSIADDLSDLLDTGICEPLHVRRFRKPLIGCYLGYAEFTQADASHPRRRLERRGLREAVLQRAYIAVKMRLAAIREGGEKTAASI
jgi:hypothetical protein